MPSVDHQRFPRLHPAYFCWCNIHSKDALQIVALLSFLSLLYSSLLFLLHSSSSSSSFFLFHSSLLLLDLVALVLLLLAYIREDHRPLVPVLLYEAVFAAVLTVGAILCMLALIKDGAWPELATKRQQCMDLWQLDVSFGQDHSRAPRKVLCVATAVLLSLASFVFLWLVHVCLICVRYFRDLSAHNRRKAFGHDEFGPSPISERWTKAAVMNK